MSIEYKYTLINRYSRYYGRQRIPEYTYREVNLERRKHLNGVRTTLSRRVYSDSVENCTCFPAEILGEGTTPKGYVGVMFRLIGFSRWRLEYEGEDWRHNYRHYTYYFIIFDGENVEKTQKRLLKQSAYYPATVRNVVWTLKFTFNPKEAGYAEV